VKIKTRRILKMADRELLKSMAKYNKKASIERIEEWLIQIVNDSIYMTKKLECRLQEIKVAKEEVLEPEKDNWKDKLVATIDELNSPGWGIDVVQRALSDYQTAVAVLETIKAFEKEDK